MDIEKFVNDWVKKFSGSTEDVDVKDTDKLIDPNKEEVKQDSSTLDETKLNEVLTRFQPVFNKQQERIQQLEQELIKRTQPEEPKESTKKSKINREQLLEKLSENFAEGVSWAYEQQYGINPISVIPALVQEVTRMKQETEINRFQSRSKDYDDQNPQHYELLGRVHRERQAPMTALELETSWLLAKQRGWVPQAQDNTEDKNIREMPVPGNINRTRRSAPSPSAGSSPSFSPNELLDDKLRDMPVDKLRELIGALQEKQNKIVAS